MKNARIKKPGQCIFKTISCDADVGPELRGKHSLL
jgi:hypothetical protein